MKWLNLSIKRGFDISVSFISLLVLSPIFVLIIFLMKLLMPGPLFFIQTRVGKDKRLFNIYKFRTMKVDKKAEENHDVSKDQQRITPLGKFMRRTKIDELPQILNVLKGDMSLVGPRPTFSEQVKNYDNRQMRRLSMRPGMTGLAQVNGNVALSWSERIEYDIQYIDNFSFLLDMKILLKTIGVVLFGEEKYKK